MIKLRTLLNEMIFDAKTINVDEINKRINAPYVNASTMSLGGPGRESLAIKLSLDDKNVWPNKIIENSRYLLFMASNDDNSLKLLSGFRPKEQRLKFRKTRVNSVDDIINKINKYIELVSQ